jgi:hypothetical protein
VKGLSDIICLHHLQFCEIAQNILPERRSIKSNNRHCA